MKTRAGHLDGKTWGSSRASWRGSRRVALGLVIASALAACSSTTTTPADDAGTPTKDAATPPSVLPDGAPLPEDAGVLPPPPEDGGALPGFAYRPYPAPATNPGNLVAYAEAPSGNPSRTLVVVLHGCTQRASDMASAGFSDAAGAYGFAALYIEQVGANDASSCFRWYTKDHASRGKGELASIASFAADAKARLGADRVFVAGLSAGGAMAAAFLASYPELVSGASLQAGIPFGCASNAFEGAGCANAPRSLSAQQWGDLVRGAATPSADVRVQLWHGDADPIVKPANADALVAQWTDVTGADATADDEKTEGLVTKRTYNDGAGKPRVELDLVRGFGHGTPISTQGSDAPCGRPGTYAADVGACAAASAARFFGLTKLAK